MEDLYSIPFGTLNITLKIREYDISFFFKKLSPIRKCININLKFSVFGFRVPSNDHRSDASVTRTRKYTIYSIRFVHFVSTQTHHERHNHIKLPRTKV